MRLLYTLLVAGHVFCLSQAIVPVIPPDGSLSSLAMKMQDICTNSSDLNELRSKCPTSSTTIWADKYPDPKPKIPEKHYFKVKQQNQILLTEVINRAFSKRSVPEHEPVFGFELLSAIFGVFAKACPVVPLGFLQKVNDLFTHLHYKTTADRTEYFPGKYKKWLLRLFNNCTENVVHVKLLTETCKETVTAVKNCSDFVCTQPMHEFRLMKADPIVDVVFKAFELVQSICFPYFEESYRIWHYFHLAVADVFTDDIKIRWITQLEGFRYWKNLLGPNFQAHLMNIEKCNEGIISSSRFNFRIPRESLPARIRLTGVKREFGIA